MAPNRYYSSNAVETTLTNPVSNAATSIQVDSVTGYPTSYPFTLQVELGTSNEEIMEVTNVSGTTLTVIRGVDGSSALTHTSGAKVVHGVSARDFREPQEHLGSVLGVHGLGASTGLVGTDTVQTLSNKTLASPVLTGPSIDTFTNAQHNHAGAAGGGSTLGAVGTPVTLAGAPAITDYTNAGHDHSSVAKGGRTLGAVGLGVTLAGQPTIADLTNTQHNHGSIAKGGNIPQVGVTGLTERLTALETDVSSNSNTINAITSQPFTKLTRSSNQSIPDSALTIVSWNVETEDIGGGWVSSSPTRFTAPRDGVYHVNVVVQWSNHATGLREMTIRKNGSSTPSFDGQRGAAASNVTVVQSTSRFIRLVTGDYLEVAVYQNSGIALPLDQTFHDGPQFEAMWVRY